MSDRIRDHFAQGQAFGPGYDLKRGRGGIREIEFFAQVHQLIYGGREPALRAPATVDALAALAQAGRIAPDIAARLADHYRSEEHTSELQSLMRISFAVFCLKKKNNTQIPTPFMNSYICFKTRM